MTHGNFEALVGKDQGGVGNGGFGGHGVESAVAKTKCQHLRVSVDIY